MYTFDSRIRYGETNETGALSLLGVINYMQDCSTFQSEGIGLGVEYLEKKEGVAVCLPGGSLLTDIGPGRKDKNRNLGYFF